MDKKVKLTKFSIKHAMIWSHLLEKEEHNKDITPSLLEIQVN